MTLAKLIVQIGANTAEFESNLKKASTQLKGFSNDVKVLSPAFDAIGNAIKVVGVAMIGAFVGGGTAALVSAAKIEQYRLSLDTLMGSSKAAGEAVASAINLASKTPFTDEQLLAATVALEKFGQDAQTVLPQVANMAAATNKDVAGAAEAFGAFLQGRVKALASYGITKAAVLAEGAATEQGIQIANEKGTIVNEAAYNAALLSLMDKRFADGANKQANSISGLKTRLQDAADDALRTIAGVTDQGDILAGGLADTFKKAVTMIIAKIDEWKANGSLQRWASDVGQAITAFFNGAKIVFEWLVNIATWIAKNWQAIVPVIGGVIGAFVAFKVVATYVTLATTAIKLFGSAASIAALGPIALIIGAVAALAAGITYLIMRQQQENALLNPSLVGAASVEHIKALTAAMTEYDAVTERTGSSMLEQHQAGYYASRVAGHQKYVNDLKQQNDLLAKAALDSRNATAKGTEAGYAKTAAAAVANNAKTVASDADLANKILDLTQTKLQSKLRAIDIEAKAMLADGKNEVQVAEWVKVAKAAANKDAADAAGKLTEAATKKTSEEAAKILGINADLNDKSYKLSHTAVEGQIYDLAKERDAAIADGGSKLEADKVYVLASKKVYDDARKEKAAADKEAQDKYLASVADYASKEKDAVTTLTQTIVDNYQIRENAAIKQLKDERDARLAAINTQISDLTGQHDKAAQSDKMAGLAANFANATTEEARAAASKTLMDAVNEEAYQNQLASLKKEQETVADKYNNSDTGMIASIVTFYDQKMAAANVNAEAEELLANTTTMDIIKTLESHLPEFASMGAAAGNAFAADYRAAIASTGILGSTANPITVAANPITVATHLMTPAEMLAMVNTASFGGGSGRSLMAHANGGYFTTPHIALIAENGPEAVVPQSQASSFAKQMGGSNDALLRQLGLKLDMLTFAVRQVAPGVGSAVNGLGRV